MADRTKVQRDKHESATERPREAKMARARRPRDQTVNYGGGGGRTAGEKGSTTRTRPGAKARKTGDARRTVQSRNAPAHPRRAAERLNRPQTRRRAPRDTNEGADFADKRRENMPAGVRRATEMTQEEVASPDVSLEFAHGPEGEANAGQDLREPRMMPKRGRKDPNARHPKGRAERRPGDRARAGET